LGIVVAVVEQAIFDQRRDDPVERATAKTEGQQPAVFAVSQGQGVTALARASGAPVVALTLSPKLAGDACGAHF